jgi:AraC-like DNA-binding protein
MEYLHSASIGLAVFIIALILGKRNRSVSDHFLVLWLCILTVNFVSVFLLNTKNGDFVVWERLLLEFSEASIFIHGPILYFYTLSLTQVSFEVNRRNALHAIPFFLALSLLVVPIFYGEEANFNLRNLLLTCKMTSLLIYIILVLRILFAHKKKVDEIFSNTEEKHLTWLFLVALGMLCIWIIAVISLFLDRVMDLEIPQYGGLLINIASSIFLFVMGYFGVKQPSLFVEYSEKSISDYELETETIKSKYEKSGLTEKEAITIHKRTVEFMTHEKPYLNPELNLYLLAERLNLLPNHLSQAINSVERKNFFDFVNHYRIQEVKKCLVSNEKEHLTLLGIAFECGFNSKTSFNRTFKKIVGLTPSEFRKKVLLKEFQ